MYTIKRRKKGEKMSLDAWINLGKDVGFPILIAIYFMFRLNRSFSHLEQAVRNLVQEIHEEE